MVKEVRKGFEEVVVGEISFLATKFILRCFVLNVIRMITLQTSAFLRLSKKSGMFFLKNTVNQDDLLLKHDVILSAAKEEGSTTSTKAKV